MTTILHNETDLINQYNKISKKHLRLGSLLPDLSDTELFIWIAGQTYKYGRSFQDSLNNATSHMKNRTAAEKAFGVKHNDLLGL